MQGIHDSNIVFRNFQCHIYFNLLYIYIIYIYLFGATVFLKMEMLCQVEVKIFTPSFEKFAIGNGVYLFGHQKSCFGHLIAAEPQNAAATQLAGFSTKMLIQALVLPDCIV